MRILANENIPGDLVRVLRDASHDVAWVREDSPGADDIRVLARAQIENRIVLTSDKDFGELAFRAGLPAERGIVLLRIASASSDDLCSVVSSALDAGFPEAGHFVVIERDRIRVTPLPSGS